VSTFRTALIASCVVSASLITEGHAARLRQAADDPFAFFQPLVTVRPSDRQRIDRGEILARILPGRDGDVVVFAASRLDSEPEALVHWTRAIEAMKTGPFVKAIRRFSDPPVLSDLDALVLDEVDLQDIRRCRSGKCGMKLAEPEIQSLRMAAAVAGAEWKSAVQQEFRRVLLARVARYHAEGVMGLGPYVDHSEVTLPRDVFASIVDRSPYLRGHMPAIADGLLQSPKVDLPNTESFLYWSKEHYGSGKPVIAVTHVHIVRPGGSPLPDVLVLGQEVYASHYRDGSLGITAIVGGGDTARYLLYLNRSRLDMLGGLLGGLKRSLIEGRLESEVKPTIATVRRRLESAGPYADP